MFHFFKVQAWTKSVEKHHKNAYFFPSSQCQKWKLSPIECLFSPLSPSKVAQDNMRIIHYWFLDLNNFEYGVEWGSYFFYLVMVVWCESYKIDEMSQQFCPGLWLHQFATQPFFSVVTKNGCVADYGYIILVAYFSGLP